MDAESHHDKFGVFGLSRFPELFLLSDLLVFGAQALIHQVAVLMRIAACDQSAFFVIAGAGVGPGRRVVIF